MPTFVEGLVLVGYILVMPLAFVIYLAWLIREFRQTSQLRTAGVLTNGLIISHRNGILTRGRPYFISYRFKINTDTLQEQMVTSEQEVNHKRYTLLDVGTSVEVSYLSDAPQISRLAGSNMDNTSRLRATYYTLLLACVWLAIFIKIISR